MTTYLLRPADVLDVDMAVAVRKKIDQNGEPYLSLHGQTIHVPKERWFRPDPEHLRWHNENRYRG